MPGVGTAKLEIAAEQITGANAITAKVSDTKGLKFEKIAWEGINQLDRLDGRHALVLRTGLGNSQNLETLALP